MSFIESVAFIFFFANMIVFFMKIINIVSYKLDPSKPSERTLKYYGFDLAIVTLLVSLFAWLFMFMAFTEAAVETQWLINQGIPTINYLNLSTLYTVSWIMLVFNGLFTFFEIILLGWAEIRFKQERFRRYSPRERRKVSLRQ